MHVKLLSQCYIIKNKHQFYASGDDAPYGFRYVVPSAASLAGV